MPGKDNHQVCSLHADCPDIDCDDEQIPSAPTGHTYIAYKIKAGFMCNWPPASDYANADHHLYLDNSGDITHGGIRSLDFNGRGITPSATDPGVKNAWRGVPRGFGNPTIMLQLISLCAYLVFF